MSENLVSEGRLLTLEGATAFSNIAAGALVAVATGINSIFSADREAASNSSTAMIGGAILGVLDESVSAGQEPITVWTEGVFKFRVASSSTLSATAMIGKPVYTVISGGGFLVDTTAVTGDYPIGTIVSVPNGLEPSGKYVNVKITPGAFRWGVYGVQTATQINNFGHVFPPII